MELLTREIEEKMRKNAALTHVQKRDYPEIALDHEPVVKLFTPDAQCTWLLSELDVGDADRAFGLCDLGMGFFELGYVSLRELSAVRGSLGLPIERDLSFQPTQSMSGYIDDAIDAGRIVT